jgi:two-component system cell cycle response regulator
LPGGVVAEEEEQQARKPRILLADDSKVVRVSATRILGEDFDLVLAEDGEEAWGIIGKDADLNAVFTDIGMPELDGYGLLKRIRNARDERIKTLPVIVVTGNEGDDARHQALDAGATDFVSKPFNKLDLVARARSHVENYQRLRALKQATKELEQYATIDPLTRLGNRQHFVDKFKQARAFALRHRQALSLLRLDLHDARGIAAKHGKETVEILVKELGSIIRTAVRTEDSAARIGSVQFAVVLPTCDEKGAQVIAMRLLRTVEVAGQRYAKKGIRFTASVGITEPSAHPELSVKELLGFAEEAVKDATAAGGGKLVLGRIKTAKAAAPLAPAAGTAPSIDEALRMIAAGEGQTLLPHLNSLLQRLLPLLKLASRYQKASLAAYLDRSARRKD